MVTLAVAGGHMHRSTNLGGKKERMQKNTDLTGPQKVLITNQGTHIFPRNWWLPGGH